MKFFTLLAPGFNTQLNLPHHFCKVAKGDFSGEAVVVSILGRWMIKSRKEKGRFYFHGEEWVKFVNGHELEEGGLLVFEHHGSFLFHAEVFDASACQKLDTQQPTSTSDDDETEPLRRDTNPTPLRRFANPTFTRTLSACSSCEVQKNEICYLYLPIKIWRSNNLEEKTEAILRISGLERKEWKANLTFYGDHIHGRHRLLVRRGWYEFVSANNLKKGHKCEFEIIMDASEFGYSNRVIIIIVIK